MPAQNIKISSGDCSLPPISVDRQVVTGVVGTDFKFFNQLDGGNSAPDAIVKFYTLLDKGEIGAEITDYCGANTGDMLSVGPGQPTTCSPTLPGDYAYTVEADGYATLDPVLIIEPSSSSDFLLSQQPQPEPGGSLLLPGVTLIAGLLVGHMLGGRG